MERDDGTGGQAGSDADADADAVVVGSGPNGLSAAITLARAGLQVHVVEAEPTLGGGVRSELLELVEGTTLLHDLCSAVHPLLLASPFITELGAERLGIELRVPPASYAQPLDDVPAAIAWRDLDRTVDGLGEDGRAWRRLIGNLSHHAKTVVALGLGSQRRIPARALRDPLGSLAFAAALLEQAGPLADLRFRGDAAAALLTGVAAHTITRLPSLASSGASLLLASLAHAPLGWPLPRGGSAAVSAALVAEARTLGVTFATGTRITRADQLPPARAVLFDTSAAALLDIYAGRFANGRNARWANGVRRMGFGSAAAKVDFVVNARIPWRDADVGQAAVAHLGGTRDHMRAAEAAVARGNHADHPVTLVSNPALTDPDRTVNGLTPIWSYAHVPSGSTRDVTEAVIAQIERFAPGFRDSIVASRCIPAARMSEHNQNYVGGDIAAGRVSMFRMIARPTLSPDPHRTPLPGVYLCSQSSTPGPGVHGMAGYFAARSALHHEFGLAAHRLTG